MFQKLIARWLGSALTSVLGEYVEMESFQETLKVGVWNGLVVLENLNVKAGVLDSLDMPLSLSHGQVGRLELKIPWAYLGRDPLVLVVNSVSLCAHPRYEWDDDAKEAKAQAIKMAKVAAVERWKLAAYEATGGAGTGWGGSAQRWLFEKLVNKLIDSIQISVREVHIRYEDALSSPDCPFYVGITFECLDISTKAAEASRRQEGPAGCSEESGSEAAALSASKVISKSITLSHFCVYWNTAEALNPCCYQIGKMPRKEATMVMHHLVSRKDTYSILSQEKRRWLDGSKEAQADSPPSWMHRFIVHPVNVCALVDISKYSRAFEIPRVSMCVDVETVAVRMEDFQYRDAMCLAAAFAQFSALEMHSQFRPKVGVGLDPKAWWMYAIRASLHRDEQEGKRKIPFRLSWEKLKERRDLRRQYIPLWLRSKNGRGPSVVDVEESGVGAGGGEAGSGEEERREVEGGEEGRNVKESEGSGAMEIEMTSTSRPSLEVTLEVTPGDTAPESSQALASEMRRRSEPLALEAGSVAAVLWEDGMDSNGQVGGGSGSGTAGGGETQALETLSEVDRKRSSSSSSNSSSSSSSSSSNRSGDGGGPARGRAVSRERGRSRRRKRSLSMSRPLSPKGRKHLEALEKFLSFEDIMMFRSLAERQALRDGGGRPGGNGPRSGSKWGLRSWVDWAVGYGEDAPAAEEGQGEEAEGGAEGGRKPAKGGMEEDLERFIEEMDAADSAESAHSLSPGPRRGSRAERKATLEGDKDDDENFHSPSSPMPGMSPKGRVSSKPMSPPSMSPPPLLSLVSASPAEECTRVHIKARLRQGSLTLANTTRRPRGKGADSAPFLQVQFSGVEVGSTVVLPQQQPQPQRQSYGQPQDDSLSDGSEPGLSGGGNSGPCVEVMASLADLALYEVHSDGAQARADLDGMVSPWLVRDGHRRGHEYVSGEKWAEALRGYGMPAAGFSLSRVVTRREASARSGPAATADVGDLSGRTASDIPSLFSMRAVFNPRDSEVDASLQLNVDQVEAVLNPAAGWLNALGSFTTTPELLRYWQDLEMYAVNGFDTVRSQISAKLEYLALSRSKLFIHLKVQAPVLLIPADVAAASAFNSAAAPTTETASASSTRSRKQGIELLVVDLGRVELTTHSLAQVDQVEEALHPVGGGDQEEEEEEQEEGDEEEEEEEGGTAAAWGDDSGTQPYSPVSRPRGRTRKRARPRGRAAPAWKKNFYDVFSLHIKRVGVSLVSLGDVEAMRLLRIEQEEEGPRPAEMRNMFGGNPLAGKEQEGKGAEEGGESSPKAAAKPVDISTDPRWGLIDSFDVHLWLHFSIIPTDHTLLQAIVHADLPKLHVHLSQSKLERLATMSCALTLAVEESSFAAAVVARAEEEKQAVATVTKAGAEGGASGGLAVFLDFQRAMGQRFDAIRPPVDDDGGSSTTTSRRRSRSRGRRRTGVSSPAESLGERQSVGSLSRSRSQSIEEFQDALQGGSSDQGFASFGSFGGDSEEEEEESRDGRDGSVQRRLTGDMQRNIHQTYFGGDEVVQLTDSEDSLSFQDARDLVSEVEQRFAVLHEERRRLEQQLKSPMNAQGVAEALIACNEELEDLQRTYGDMNSAFEQARSSGSLDLHLSNGNGTDIGTGNGTALAEEECVPQKGSNDGAASVGDSLADSWYVTNLLDNIGSPTKGSGARQAIGPHSPRRRGAPLSVSTSARLMTPGGRLMTPGGVPGGGVPASPIPAFALSSRQGQGPPAEEDEAEYPAGFQGPNREICKVFLTVPLIRVDLLYTAEDGGEKPAVVLTLKELETRLHSQTHGAEVSLSLKDLEVTDCLASEALQQRERRTSAGRASVGMSSRRRSHHRQQQQQQRSEREPEVAFTTPDLTMFSSAPANPVWAAEPQRRKLRRRVSFGASGPAPGPASGSGTHERREHPTRATRRKRPPSLPGGSSGSSGRGGSSRGKSRRSEEGGKPPLRPIAGMHVPPLGTAPTMPPRKSFVKLSYVVSREVVSEAERGRRGRENGRLQLAETHVVSLEMDAFEVGVEQSSLLILLNMANAVLAAASPSSSSSSNSSSSDGGEGEGGGAPAHDADSHTLLGHGVEREAEGRGRRRESSGAASVDESGGSMGGSKKAGASDRGQGRSPARRGSGSAGQKVVVPERSLLVAVSLNRAAFCLNDSGNGVAAVDLERIGVTLKVDTQAAQLTTTLRNIRLYDVITVSAPTPGERLAAAVAAAGEGGGGGRRPKGGRGQQPVHAPPPGGGVDAISLDGDGSGYLLREVFGGQRGNRHHDADDKDESCEEEDLSSSASLDESSRGGGRRPSSTALMSATLQVEGPMALLLFGGKGEAGHDDVVEVGVKAEMRVRGLAVVANMPFVAKALRYVLQGALFTHLQQHQASAPAATAAATATQEDPPSPRDALPPDSEEALSSMPSDLNGVRVRLRLNVALDIVQPMLRVPLTEEEEVRLEVGAIVLQAQSLCLTAPSDVTVELCVAGVKLVALLPRRCEVVPAAHVRVLVLLPGVLPELDGEEETRRGERRERPEGVEARPFCPFAWHEERKALPLAGQQEEREDSQSARGRRRRRGRGRGRGSLWGEGEHDPLLQRLCLWMAQGDVAKLHMSPPPQLLPDASDNKAPQVVVSVGLLAVDLSPDPLCLLALLGAAYGEAYQGLSPLLAPAGHGASPRTTAEPSSAMGGSFFGSEDAVQPGQPKPLSGLKLLAALEINCVSIAVRGGDSANVGVGLGGREEKGKHHVVHPRVHRRRREQQQQQMAHVHGGGMQATQADEGAGSEGTDCGMVLLWEVTDVVAGVEVSDAVTAGGRPGSGTEEGKAGTCRVEAGVGAVSLFDGRTCREGLYDRLFGKGALSSRSGSSAGRSRGNGGGDGGSTNTCTAASEAHMHVVVELVPDGGSESAALGSLDAGVVSSLSTTTVMTGVYRCRVAAQVRPTQYVLLPAPLLQCLDLASSAGRMLSTKQAALEGELLFTGSRLRAFASSPSTSSGGGEPLVHSATSASVIGSLHSPQPMARRALSTGEWGDSSPASPTGATACPPGLSLSVETTLTAESGGAAAPLLPTLALPSWLGAIEASVTLAPLEVWLPDSAFSGQAVVLSCGLGTVAEVSLGTLTAHAAHQQHVHPPAPIGAETSGSQSSSVDGGVQVLERVGRVVTATVSVDKFGLCAARAGKLAFSSASEVNRSVRPLPPQVSSPTTPFSYPFSGVASTHAGTHDARAREVKAPPQTATRREETKRLAAPEQRKREARSLEPASRTVHGSGACVSTGLKRRDSFSRVSLATHTPAEGSRWSSAVVTRARGVVLYQIVRPFDLSLAYGLHIVGEGQGPEQGTGEVAPLPARTLSLQHAVNVSGGFLKVDVSVDFRLPLAVLEHSLTPFLALGSQEVPGRGEVGEQQQQHGRTHSPLPQQQHKQQRHKQQQQQRQQHQQPLHQQQEQRRGSSAGGDLFYSSFVNDSGRTLMRSRSSDSGGSLSGSLSSSGAATDGPPSASSLPTLALLQRLVALSSVQASLCVEGFSLSVLDRLEVTSHSDSPLLVLKMEQIKGQASVSTGLETVEASLCLPLRADYLNVGLDAWEPFLQPWKLEALFSSDPGGTTAGGDEGLGRDERRHSSSSSSGQEPAAFSAASHPQIRPTCKLRFKAEEQLKVNVTEACLGTVAGMAVSVQKLLQAQQPRPSEGASGAADKGPFSLQQHREVPFSLQQHRVRNETGMVLDLQLLPSEEDEDEDRGDLSSHLSTTVLPPGVEQPLAFLGVCAHIGGPNEGDRKSNLGEALGEDQVQVLSLVIRSDDGHLWRSEGMLKVDLTRTTSHFLRRDGDSGASSRSSTKERRSLSFPTDGPEEQGQEQQQQPGQLNGGELVHMRDDKIAEPRPLRLLALVESVRGCSVLRLCSPLLIRNHLGDGVVLRAAVRSAGWDIEIPSGQDRTVPLSVAAALQDEEGNSVLSLRPVPGGSGVVFEEEVVSVKELGDETGPQSGTLQFSDSRSEQQRQHDLFCRLEVGREAEQALVLTLAAPMLVRNLLAAAADVKLAGTQMRGVLSSGEAGAASELGLNGMAANGRCAEATTATSKASKPAKEAVMLPWEVSMAVKQGSAMPLLSAHPSDEVSLSIRLPGFNWSEAFCVQEAGARDQDRGCHFGRGGVSRSSSRSSSRVISRVSSSKSMVNLKAGGEAAAAAAAVAASQAGAAVSGGGEEEESSSSHRGVMVRDAQGRSLSVCVDVSLRGGVREVVLWVPYWLVNATSLPLVLQHDPDAVTDEALKGLAAGQMAVDGGGEPSPSKGVGAGGGKKSGKGGGKWGGGSGNWGGGNKPGRQEKAKFDEELNEGGGTPSGTRRKLFAPRRQSNGLKDLLAEGGIGVGGDLAANGEDYLAQHHGAAGAVGGAQGLEEDLRRYNILMMCYSTLTKDEEQGRAMVRLGRQDSSACPPSCWSRPFDMDQLGKDAVLVVRGGGAGPSSGGWWRSRRWGAGKRQTFHRGNEAYVMGVSVKAAPGPFHRTKVVSLTPRYVMVNLLGRAIEVKQAGVPPNHRTSVPKDGQTAFHWSDGGSARQLELRLEEMGWDWSGRFSPDGLGEDITLRLRNVSHGMLFVRVEVVPQGPTLMVVFRRELPNFAPYRIENESFERLSLRQVGVDNIVETLLPYHSCAFTWDEPTKPHLLVVEAQRPIEKGPEQHQADVGGQLVGEISLDRLRRYPNGLNGTLGVEVVADGPVRVLRFSDARFTAQGGQDEAGKGGGGGAFVPIRSTRSFPSVGGPAREGGDGLEEESPAVTNRPVLRLLPMLKLQLELEGVELSVVNSTPMEMMLLSVGGIRLTYSHSEAEEVVDLTVRSVQVDNQLSVTPYPVLLRTLHHPFLSAVLVREFGYEGINFVRLLRLGLSPMEINVDAQLLLALVGFANRIVEKLEVQPPSLAAGQGQSYGQFYGQSYGQGQLRLDLSAVTTLSAQNRNSIQTRSRLYLDKFEIDPICLEVSFRAGELAHWHKHSPLKHLLEAIYSPLLSAFGNIENVQLNLRSVGLQQTFASTQELVKKLVAHYYGQAARATNLLLFLGSVRVLGNPMELAKNVSRGITDFRSEVLAGLRRSPLAFLFGLKRGTSSLVFRLVYTVSQGARSILSSLTSGLLATRAVDLHLEDGRVIRPSAWVLDGIVLGLVGAVSEPVLGLQNGLLGLIKGLTTGLVGLTFKPAYGALLCASNVCRLTSKVVLPHLDQEQKRRMRRARPPRFLYPNRAMGMYCARESLGEELLSLVRVGKYSSDGYVWHCDVYESDDTPAARMVLSLRGLRRGLLEAFKGGGGARGRASSSSREGEGEGEGEEERDARRRARVALLTGRRLLMLHRGELEWELAFDRIVSVELRDFLVTVYHIGGGREGGGGGGGRTRVRGGGGGGRSGGGGGDGGLRFAIRSIHCFDRGEAAELRDRLNKASLCTLKHKF